MFYKYIQEGILYSNTSRQRSVTIKYVREKGPFEKVAEEYLSQDLSPRQIKMDPNVFIYPSAVYLSDFILIRYNKP